jgi:hypothetical protein
MIAGECMRQRVRSVEIPAARRLSTWARVMISPFLRTKLS